MKTIEVILLEEKAELEKIINDAQKRLKKAPQGHIRITEKNGKPHFYYKGEKMGKGNGQYMKKAEGELIRNIAQKDYDIRVVKKAQERVKAINAFLVKYEDTSLKQMYQKTNQYRKELICASVISDKEFIKQWQSVKYVGKSFQEDGPEFMTEKGERVRSKSEKIIADKLYMLGIPYRYEYPLVLDGNVKVYPDFTILKMPERKEVYLEHLGMMDDMEYVNSTIYKLNTYEKNAIYLGVQLFVTYETSRKALNVRALDDMIKKVFCTY